MPVSAPLAFNFRRRRTSFDIAVEEIMGSVRNGMRIPNVINEAKLREARFLEWLKKTGIGSRPEYMVFAALERTGLLAPQSEPPGFDFQFQVPVLGGRGSMGGAVLDFIIWSAAPTIAIRVQGEFFHFIDDDAEASDIFERAQLEAEGFTVVDILAQDCLTEIRTDEVVALALIGMQLDFTGRLQIF
jgi:hypothetical protein